MRTLDGHVYSHSVIDFCSQLFSQGRPCVGWRRNSVCQSGHCVSSVVKSLVVCRSLRESVNSHVLSVVGRVSIILVIILHR